MVNLFEDRRADHFNGEIDGIITMCSRSFDSLDCVGLERHQNISVQYLVVFIIMKSKLPLSIFLFPISVIEHKKADESQLLIFYLEIKTT